MLKWLTIQELIQNLIKHIIKVIDSMNELTLALLE